MASGPHATAMGANSVANGANSVASGANAMASADNSVALGANSIADRANTVSVGSFGAERQVTNVAAGTRDTDAVNVNQLQGVATQVHSVATSTAAALGGGSTVDSAGNITAPNYNVGGKSYGSVGDAITTLDSRLNDSFDTINNTINKVNQQANRGIAAASAVVNVTPYMPGRTTLNAGVASYRGEAALGVGVSHWTENGRVNFNGGVSMAKGDQPVFRVGVGVVLGD